MIRGLVGLDAPLAAISRKRGVGVAVNLLPRLEDDLPLLRALDGQDAQRGAGTAVGVPGARAEAASWRLPAPWLAVAAEGGGCSEWRPKAKPLLPG